MARRLALLLLSLVLLAALAAGGTLAWLVWRPDVLRGPIERRLGARLGTPVRIEGPLGLALGRVSTLELAGLSVAAPGWARSPTLATVGRLRLGVDLRSSLARRELVLAELRLEAPELSLERDAQGRTSWPAGRGGGAPPRIEALAVADGRVSYRDERAGLDVEVAGLSVAPAPGPAGGPPGLAVRGAGRAQGAPLDLALRIGAPPLLRRADASFPLAGMLTLAGARLGLRGEAREPLALDGLTLDLDLASEDPRPLLALLGRPVREPLPPLGLAGRLTREGHAVALRDLRASWGESRLEGGLRYDRATDRPRIEGELRAPVLDLVALRPLAAAGGTPPAPAGSGSLLASHDARLRLGAGSVRLPGLELREVEAGLTLAQGRLTLEPLDATLGGGRLAGRLATGPLDRGFAGEVSLRGEGVDLAALFSASAGVAGRLGGELAGTLSGDTAAELAARSRLRLRGRAEALRLPRLAEVLPSLAVEGALEPGEERPLRVTAEGTLGDAPLRLEGRGGPPAAPGDDGTSYPLAVQARLGATDLAAELSLHPGGPRPALSGRVRSRHLDLDGLARLAGIPAGGAGPGEPRAEGRDEAPPAGRPDPASWRRLDLDLALAAERVTAERLPVDGFELGLALKDGRLRVEPLDLRVGEGRVGGRVALDAGRPGGDGELGLTLSRLPVARVLRRPGPDGAALGALSGRVEARLGPGGGGFGVAEMLRRADGGATLLLEGGTIDRRLVAAVSLDLPELLGSLLGGGAPEKVELRCTLADLALQNGVLTTRSLVVATADATIGGEGRVDLGTGRLELELLAPRGAAPLPDGRSGVRITGTLGRPEVAVDRAALAARGAGAATLGVLLAPFAALASGLGGGGEAPGPCAGLLGEGRGEGPRPGAGGGAPASGPGRVGG